VAGVVTLYDMRALGTPITEFQRNKAGIEDLVFTVGGSLGSNIGLEIATTDGLPYIASIIPEGVVVGAEIVTLRGTSEWGKLWMGVLRCGAQAMMRSLEGI
jgi:hypothetical protein